MIQLVPSLSVINGKTVRLSKGDYSQEKEYKESPLDIAKKFEEYGIRRIHLVDLEGAKKGSIVNYHILETIAGHTNLKINFSGGIHTDGDISQAFEYGAESITAATSEVQAVVLEVLKTNKAAIKAYKQIGFEKTRIFESFRLINKVGVKATPDIKISKCTGLNCECECFGDESVSFSDTFDQLQYNLDNELVLEASILNEPVGYIILQPSLGRISQFAVQKQFRRKGVGTNLIREAQIESSKSLTVVNVNKRDHQTIKFLGAIGFIHSLTQLEMQLPLK